MCCLCCTNSSSGVTAISQWLILLVWDYLVFLSRIKMESVVEQLKPYLTTEVLVAVVVVALAVMFAIVSKGKKGNFRSQLLSARKEIRELLDRINCGASTK